MKDQRMFWVLLLVVVMVLNSARAGVTKAYFLNGGELKLGPTVTPNLTGILWKHNGDLLAEWIKNNVALTYYGDYDGRTTLDLNTGHLEIRNMDETKDSGSYTLEINNHVHDESYNAIRIKKVPEPSVWITPVACDHFKSNCNLSCDGDTAEAEPVTYTWMMDDKVWDGVEEKQVLISKTKTEHVKTFSCSMKNPVSKKDSKPKDNPFYKKPEPFNPVGVVVGVIVLLGAGALSVVGYLKRDYIKSRLFRPSEGGGTADSPSGSELKNNSPQPADDPLLGNEGKGDPSSNP